MMVKCNRWVLEYVDDHLCDVVRNGRRLRSNMTWAAAAALLRKQKQDGDSILREKADGYRIPVKLSTLS